MNKYPITHRKTANTITFSLPIDPVTEYKNLISEFLDKSQLKASEPKNRYICDSIIKYGYRCLTCENIKDYGQSKPRFFFYFAFLKIVRFSSLLVKKILIDPKIRDLDIKNRIFSFLG